MGTERARRWLRRAGLTIAALTLLFQIVGLVATYWFEESASRGYASVGLSFQRGQMDERVLGDPVGPATRAAGFVRGDRIVAIDSVRIPDDPEPLAVAEALEGDGTGSVILRIARADGSMRDVRIARSDGHAASEPRFPIGRGAALLIGLIAATLMQIALTGLAMLLLVKRWRDPVALLFAFTFLAMAAGSDRTGAMIAGLVGGWFVPAATAAWLTGLVVGLATFPDGRLHGRRSAWLALAALPLAVLFATRVLPPTIGQIGALALALAALASLWARYRTTDGAERQQLKWAGYGFALGIVALAVSTVLVRMVQEDVLSGAAAGFAELAGRLLYAVGFAAFPATLTIAMLRFRLWAVDRAISRSSALGIVTLMLGGVWAGAQEVLVLGFTTLGDAVDPTTIAGVSTALVAILFPPLQARIERWTRRRLHEPVADLEALPDRWLRMSLSQSSRTIVADALDRIGDAVSAAGGDAYLYEPGGMRRLATTGAGDHFPVPDQDPWSNADPAAGPVAILLTLGPGALIRIGRRPDGSRYSRDLVAAVHALGPALTAAVDAALVRERQEERIAQLGDRLARVEAIASR